MRDFNFSTEVRVRLPETDTFGIAFHGWFFTYMDVGRMDYLRNLGLLEGVRLKHDFPNLVAAAHCDFRSPARFDDPIVVHVRISEIGRTSFTFRFAFVHKRTNELVAEGHSVHVAMDFEAWKPSPVPEPFRVAIRRFEGASLKERSA